MRLRNTFTRERDTLHTREPGKVGLYVCGPTVYDHPHIGHARVYVVFDTLVRTLERIGYDVLYVRNITDLDDKIIQRAAEAGEPFDVLARRFTESFHADMTALNVRTPDHEPKATEHIQEMIEIIVKLIDKGLAYVVEGDVYYAVKKFEGYGKLSGRNLDQLKAGARVEVDTRLDHPSDFALWKSARPDEPSWESPWGAGRPGWHIECSAMSLKYLGTDFDIHGGGMDLVFPHHENEIAQSEGANDAPFCRLFVHNGFVNVNKEKMSKSLGNFFLIRHAFDHGDPEALRLFLLGTHYHAPIDLKVDIDEQGAVTGFPQIEEADGRIGYYYETREGFEELASRANDAPPPEKAEQLCARFDGEFEEALTDDMNTAKAVGRLNDFLRSANEHLGKGGGIGKKQKPAAARRLLQSMLSATDSLGILQSTPAQFFERNTARKLAKLPITAEQIEAKLASRREARDGKDWAAADAIRDELLAEGIEIRDGGDTTRWRVR